MLENVLGNYLIEKGKMTKEQLNDVLLRLDKSRAKLGLIAVAEGMISLEQADSVNREQAICDKRFGDIAIEKGYLTQEQLDKILKLQGNAYMVFVQSLIDAEILSMGEIDSYLESLRVEKGYGASDIEAIKNDDISKMVSMMLPKEGAGYENHIAVALRTIIRCVDRYAYIGEVEAVADFEVEEAVTQKVLGKINVITAFTDSDGAVGLVANAYAKEELTDEEDVYDAAGEFLNCINGIYLSTYGESGCDLLPPTVVKSLDAIGDIKKCVVPIYICDKKMYFVLI